MKEAPVNSQDRGSMERTQTLGTRRIEVLVPLVGRACWGLDNVSPGFDAAGNEEGQGIGEGQQAIREAEGGMTNGILGLREHNPPEGPSAS